MTIMTKQQSKAYDDFYVRTFGEKKLNNMEEHAGDIPREDKGSTGEKIEPGLFVCSRPERR